MAGLYRESSYSSSLVGFCLKRFLRSLSVGCYHSGIRQCIAHVNEVTTTHSGETNAHLDKRIHSILFRESEPSMLVQSPPVLVRDTIAILDVQGDDSNFVNIPACGC